MSIKNVVIGIAIIILTISVAIYGISTFYPNPDHSDFCDDFRYSIEINNSEQCIAAEGKWNEFNVPKPVVGEEGYCNLNYYCEQEYNDVSEKRSKIIFLIAVPLGILVIVLGALLFSLEAVGAGLMGGGVGIILYVLGWILIPVNPNQKESKQTVAEKVVQDVKECKVSKNIKAGKESKKNSPKNDISLFGVIVLLIGVGLLMKNMFSWFTFNYTWPLILIVIGLYFIWGKNEK